MVTLVLLSSVFASTVNAILIGFVLCTFSTLMLLLIKCKTIHGLVLQGVSWTGVSPGGGGGERSGQTAQKNKRFEYEFRAGFCSAFVRSNDMLI